ncbi:hypothetical protein AB0F71_19870 [Kitasatospora sp. NPDC028055]|uniref:hypothetical protein n=1 Tax=Kitasatospora sp. NPDC028055 TaxID=3155653 RepID=UPI0033D45013
MNRYAKAALVTLGFLLLVVAVFTLLGLVPSDSELGSMLRTAGGGLLVAVTLAWGAYLAKTLRRSR